MKDNRFYVYQIIDPRNQKVLYIGKGTGGRCYFHFTISRKHQDIKEKNLFQILQSILDTTNYDQFDCVQILYRGLSDKSSRKLELDLIKKIGYENLYNVSTKAQWMIGSKWMNNGKIDKQFLKGEEIPIEFCYSGRIKNQKWAGKNKGKVWITNGIKNKMVIDPESYLKIGWTLGHTIIKNKTIHE